MEPATMVTEAFPEISAISEASLREKVIDAWVMAVRENDIDDLTGALWLPPEQARLELPDETLVAHVRDVTSGSIVLTEQLVDRRGPVVSVDTVIAGALVHDVSKLYEFAGDTTTEIGSLLVHPHYGVHVAAAVGLSVPIQHIVLSHSPRTAVEPATLEAEIVTRVDEVAASAIRLRALDDLRDA